MMKTVTEVANPKGTRRAVSDVGAGTVARKVLRAPAFPGHSTARTIMTTTPAQTKH